MFGLPAVVKLKALHSLKDPLIIIARSDQSDSLNDLTEETLLMSASVRDDQGVTAHNQCIVVCLSRRAAQSRPRSLSERTHNPL